MKRIFLILALLAAVSLSAQVTSTQRRELYENNLTEIGIGNVTGKTAVRLYGSNASVGSSAELIWDNSAAYNYVTHGQTLRIVSGSANDDTSGTGALTMQITGLDSNYAAASETVGLGGTDTVTTTEKFARVFSATVLTAGSGGENAGAIEIYNESETDTLLAKIAAGENVTKMACYTVPSGYTMYVKAISATQPVDSVTTVSLFKRPTGATFYAVDEFFLNKGRVEFEYPMLLKFNAKTDIELRAVTTNANGNVKVRLDGWYE